MILCLVAAAAIALDLLVPTGGLLSGVGLAIVLERALNWAGVAPIVRWPLAAFGMLVSVSLAIRFGERLSERLFPARIKTNVDRLVGLRGEIRVLRDGHPVVELEGDLWTARLADGASEVGVGDRVKVVALVDQVPVIRSIEE
jgi:membrane protein implicated in regulation of membrane protease activity